MSGLNPQQDVPDDWPRHDPIRLGIHVGHNKDGWWAERGRRTRNGGRSGDGMKGGTFWDLVKFFAVPRRYYIWQYNRRYPERRADV